MNFFEEDKSNLKNLTLENDLNDDQNNELSNNNDDHSNESDEIFYPVIFFNR
jgi:hypothetical protein